MKHGNSPRSIRFVNLRSYVLCLQMVIALAAVNASALGVIFDITVTGYPASGANGATVTYNNGANTLWNGSCGCYPTSGTFPATVHVVSSSFPGAAVGHLFRIDIPAGGSWAAASTVQQAVPAGASDPYTFYFTIAYGGGLGQAGTVTTNCYTQWTANVTDFCQTYYFRNNITGSLIGQQSVPPGQTKQFSYCSTEARFPVLQLSAPCDGDPAVPSRNYGTNDIYGTDGWSTPGTNRTTGAFVTPNGAAASTNLGFSGAAGAALDSTLREGFSKLRDDLVEGFGNQWMVGQDIVNSVDGVKTSVDAGTAKLTQIDTNLTGLKGIALTGLGLASTGNQYLGYIKAATEGTLAKLTTMDTAASSSASSLTGIKTDTANLPGIKTAADLANVKLEQVHTDLVNLQNYQNPRLDAISTTLTDSKAIQGNMAYDISQMRTVQGTMNSTLSGIQSGVTSIDGRLTTANTHLLNIHTAMVAQNGFVDGVEGALGTLNTTATGIKTGVDGSLTELQKQTTDFRNFTNSLRSGSVQDSLDNLNAQDVAGRAALAASDTAFNGVLAGIGSPPVTQNGGASVFQFSAGGYFWNLDPISHPKTSALCAAIKECLRWIVQMFFVWGCWQYLSAHLVAMPGAQQVRSPEISIFGNNFGVALAIPLATFITLLFAAVPAFALAYITSVSGGFFGTNPFNSFSVVSGALYLANGCLPLDVIVADIFLFAGYAVSLSHLHWFATNLVRFAIG